MINQDQLQNELIVIAHHVEDALKGLDQGDLEYTKKGLHDIKEAVDRLKKFLGGPLPSEIERIAGDL